MAQEHQAPPGADCGIKMTVVAEQLKSTLWVASAMTHNPRIIGAKQKWHSKAVSVPTKKSKKWSSFSVGRVQKTRELIMG